MSQGSEVVKQLYERFGAGDLEGLRGILHPDIDWNAAEGYPAGGRYVGHDAVFNEYFPRSLGLYSDIRLEIEEIIDAGDTVVARGRYVGTLRETGAHVAVPFAHVWRTKGGQITWFQQYADTALFDRGLGLSRAGAPAAVTDTDKTGAG